MKYYSSASSRKKIQEYSVSASVCNKYHFSTLQNIFGGTEIQFHCLLVNIYTNFLRYRIAISGSILLHGRETFKQPIRLHVVYSEKDDVVIPAGVAGAWGAWLDVGVPV